MPPRERLRIGPVRRFTRNLLVPVDIRSRRLLVKYTRDPVEARQEIRGHARLAGHYRVPALHTHLRVPGGYLLVYERLPAGTDRGLLLDLLNTTAATNELHAYMSQLTAAYRNVILATAQLAEPGLVVGKLYRDRAASGGRLDAYYSGVDFPVADGLIDVPLSRLGRYPVNINGLPYRLDWPAVLERLRTDFAAAAPVWAALTQGDPTDVNLAHPLAWLDYDTAGLNSIAGEFANFLWYTSALGGWLVPTYNPAAFADHPATNVHILANTPEIHRADIGQANRIIRIDYTMHLSEPRRAAVTAYWKQLVRPVAERLWPGSSIADLLRPYLAMRILGVYNLASLTPRDRLVLLARLAEAMSPGFDPTVYFCPQETSCPAP
ncbi:hypothetical protein ACM01_15735 [Streptomyces viridochromogenes]|uniref:Aminoglycoside phosphotransferase domain-containing protein n=1 Tax=Streptomyces viridochromogenes TaxID=1938 RepID=A0A0J8C879_STRVR|nr:hypothetical protein [Streptomyces viridochromogenes]KMS74075.1 hypothetical protein ACM01_15735 [Streptomyces viridochromogenes]